MAGRQLPNAPPETPFLKADGGQLRDGTPLQKRFQNMGGKKFDILGASLKGGIVGGGGAGGAGAGISPGGGASAAAAAAHFPGGVIPNRFNPMGLNSQEEQKQGMRGQGPQIEEEKRQNQNNFARNQLVVADSKKMLKSDDNVNKLNARPRLEQPINLGNVQASEQQSVSANGENCLGQNQMSPDQNRPGMRIPYISQLQANADKDGNDKANAVNEDDKRAIA